MNLEEKVKKVKSILPEIEVYSHNADGSIRIADATFTRDANTLVARISDIPSTVESLGKIVECGKILNATRVVLIQANEEYLHRAELFYAPSLKEQLAERLKDKEIMLEIVRRELEVSEKYDTLPESRPGQIYISELPYEVVKTREDGSVLLSDDNSWIPVDDSRWRLVFPIED